LAAAIPDIAVAIDRADKHRGDALATAMIVFEQLAKAGNVASCCRLAQAVQFRAQVIEQADLETPGKLQAIDGFRARMRATLGAA